VARHDTFLHWQGPAARRGQVATEQRWPAGNLNFSLPFRLVSSHPAPADVAMPGSLALPVRGHLPVLRLQQQASQLGSNMTCFTWYLLRIVVNQGSQSASDRPGAGTPEL
jgi:hypothetical protein